MDARRGRRGPAAARRLRLRDAARARAPAQRDDAAAAADGRRLRAARGRPRPSPPSRAPTAPRRSRSRPASTRSAPRPDGFAYDNERGRHAVELGAFEIDRLPVSNGAYAAFVEETGAEPPMYWERDGDGGWLRTAMGREPARPGAARPPRLLARRRRLRPLGGQAAAQRAGVGGRPRRGSTLSAQAWEWTSSDFLAYPGFEAFPYPEYSEVFFGDEYRVLRGGSWATHPSVDPAQLPQLGPAPAPPDLRRHPLREGRMSIAIEVHLDADAAATMARDVRRGLWRSQGAGAEVLLRRARLAALRADHRAGRVLPDPGRAGDPRRALGRDRRRRGRAAGPWSSSARARPPRPATCSARCATPAACETYVPVDISEEITHQTAELLVDEYPGLEVRGLVCDFEHHLERIPTPAGGG